MIIRKERAQDVKAITRLTERAFAPMPFSQGTEPAVIEALRRHNQLTLSLVAEENNIIIGHITFSPVTIDGVHDGWFGLGPVSVLPERQSQGIGRKLIHEGLQEMKTQNAKGCALIGNPNYYARFGFINNTDLSYGDLDRAFVQKLTLLGADRNGVLKFCKVFEEAAAP